MDELGYLKLADFGMSKKIKEDEKTMSFCGTPEYLAPEIIKGEGHNKSVDWWSLGVLIYEMLCGIPPFYNENLERMYDLICYAELKFPKKIKISKEAQDLIQGLLDRDPTTRIGSNSGITELKQHPFFASINFDLVYQRKISAPFIPLIKSKYDVTNFDDEFTTEDIVSSVIPEKNLKMIMKNQDIFKDFK